MLLFADAAAIADFRCAPLFRYAAAPRHDAAAMLPPFFDTYYAMILPFFAAPPFADAARDA